MKAFLDTSSLIKLYHQEEGSDSVMKALSSDIKEIFLSELAILEFRSAIWKKIRDRNNFQWIMLQSDIVDSASHLLMKYGGLGLRTLDSLQLAAALTLRDEECVFLTSDKLLRTLFKEERLNVL